MANIGSRRGNARLCLAILLGTVLPVAGSFAVFAADGGPARAGAMKPVDFPASINLLVGFRPGAAYDLYARLTARYMLRYLSGHPEFIIENKPEAATETAKRIYQAKPDGSILAALIPALYLAQLSGKGDVGFDLSKLSWIGSPTKSHYLLYMRSTAPFKTMRDIRDAVTPPLCGAGTQTTTGYYVPKLLEETLGTRFNIRMGFEEGPDTDAAVERGEVQCRALTIDGFFSHEPYPTWIRKDIVRIILQTGSKRDSRLPKVPTLYEVMDEFKTSAPDRALVKLVLASSDFGRPLVGPPGMAADRLKTFRAAYDKAMRDPGLRREAKISPLEINPTSGSELEALARDVIAQPKDAVARMKKLMGQ